MDRRRFIARSSAALGALACSSLAGVRAGFDEALIAAKPSLPTAGDYTLAPGTTYLNHASIGTMPALVQQAHAGYLSVCETNPWLYIWGGAWAEAVDRTRSAAAALLGCDVEEVVLNRSTTDGFNLLAAGLQLAEGDEVLFGNLNHAGASVCWRHHAAARGYVVRQLEIPFDAVSEIGVEELVERHVSAIGEKTRVLVLPHMDNMLGLRTPIARIARAARRRGVRFVFGDGAQVVGMLPTDVRALGVDAYCTSPHKWLQAPKGTGLMYLSRTTQEHVMPQTVTWGQRSWAGDPRRFEDYGTRDLPATLALGDAIEFQRRAGIERTAGRRRALWSHTRERVDASSRLIWRSPLDWDLGGALIAVERLGVDSGELGRRLWEEHGVVVRAFAGEGLNTLRLSLNAANTIEEIDRFLDLLERMPR